MNLLKANNWHLTLIVLSMALLGVFLGLWLKSVYMDELEVFRKESSFLFSDAMNEWSSSSFQKIVTRSLDQPGDSTIFLNQGIKINSRLDTIIKGFSINDHKERIDTTINIKIDANLPSMEGAQGTNTEKKVFTFKGPANHFNVQGTAPDSLEVPGDQLLFFVQEKFEGALHATDLPKEFRIVKIEAEGALQEGILASNVYKDFLTGEKYAVEFEKPRPYVLQKMLPEIVFSWFLFACIGLAFGVTYQGMQKQKRLNELKNDFVSNITHELKTPITTVGVAIEALSNFNVLSDPQKTKEYLDISKLELNRLSILVDKVLKMSLFEQKELELKMETLEIKGLIWQICNSMKLQFEKHGASINFIAKEQDYQLLGDRVHLTNVIYNLFDNALKYSQENPEIDIMLLSHPDQIEIQISDKGIGIPAAYQNKIFEKFFRVPTGDQHNVKGYGLGLNYVASVIRQHGGAIQLESTPGRGTTFSIQLPKHV